jgi:ribokinase
MEVPFAQSLEVARRTKLASGTVVWNLAPVPEQMTPAMMREVLGSTDYLLVNEHEALDAAATIGAGMSDFEAAARGLAQAGSLICVVTAGALGAIAVTANGARQRASSPVIRPVDTTGAGDTFVGAFTAMLGERAPLQKPWKWGARLPP